VNHAEREAVESLGLRAYCAECRTSRAEATCGSELRARPSECFATYAGAGRWLSPARGASAHWLAHELGQAAQPGRPACAAGFALERAELLLGRRELVRELPRPTDLWVDLDAEGCGVVVRVQRDETRGFAIAIRHLRPLPALELHSDFHGQLGARGSFFR